MFGGDWGKFVDGLPETLWERYHRRCQEQRRAKHQVGCRQFQYLVALPSSPHASPCGSRPVVPHGVDATPQVWMRSWPWTGCADAREYIGQPWLQCWSLNSGWRNEMLEGIIWACLRIGEKEATELSVGVEMGNDLLTSRGITPLRS